jgi:hypothetical protein
MANQVQTEQYTDLKLLECSRKSSVEVGSGNNSNNALFMNKVEEGFMLNAGDKVSVHSAMISEVGAGNDTIELKGNYIKRVGIPHLIKFIPYNLNEYYNNDGYSDVLNTYDAVRTQKFTHFTDLHDNEVHMTLNYFKATNGENCFSLPRRFGASKKKEAYDFVDSHETGATIHQQRNGTIVEEDYGRDRNASSVWNNAWKDNRELLKVRQDGTKYTLFVRDGVTYYNPNTTVPSSPDVYESHNGNGSIDPAVATYYPYRELKSVTIPKGRRSADFIAETFTDSLQNASAIQKYEQWNGGLNPSTFTSYEGQGVLGAIYKTDTYKPFNCANSTFNIVNYTNAMAYNYNSVPRPVPTKAVLNWMNSFQNVCFKRPDFVETGRDSWGDNIFQGGRYKYITHVSNDNVSGRTTMRIVFNVTYTDQNCKKLAEWLKTQELYPEFWDFRNASGVYYNNSPRLTSTNSRFLHLDMVQAYENASKTLASDRKEFGSDMNASTTTESVAIKYNTPSEPLFITYIKDDENTFYEEPEYNSVSKKLSYGAFLNWRGVTGQAVGNIMITTEGVGGVPSRYYNASGFFIGGYEAVGNASYDKNKYKRHIGYDPHFSAYGNAAIGLYTPTALEVNEMEGNLEIGFILQNNVGAGDTLDDVASRSATINQMYLGSSNPKLTYDPTKDRFGFTEFYTPEYLGNNGGAGSDATKNPVKNDNGNALVYKINKRTQRQNYCPGMSPYPQKKTVTPQNTSGATATALEVDLPNKNIYPFSIMDCQSGIAIESFGIDEESWNKSLMGILGFTYSQLQSPVNASNTLQNRINTFNSKTLNRVTTQSVVKAQDTLRFNMNIWGAEMYHPNIASSLVLHDHKSPAKSYYQYFNPIIVDSDSLIITAEGVPRQMLAPFYTIRSDLIDDAYYMGSLDSGEKLPVIAHVLKSTDSGDFFISQDSSLEFTMTRQKPLSTITTAICDPDGTFSRVDDNSAIIYKIQKQNQLPLNIIQALFSGK